MHNVLRFAVLFTVAGSSTIAVVSATRAAADISNMLKGTQLDHLRLGTVITAVVVALSVAAFLKSGIAQSGLRNSDGRRVGVSMLAECTGIQEEQAQIIYNNLTTADGGGSSLIVDTEQRVKAAIGRLQYNADHCISGFANVRLEFVGRDCVHPECGQKDSLRKKDRNLVRVVTLESGIISGIEVRISVRVGCGLRRVVAACAPRPPRTWL